MLHATFGTTRHTFIKKEYEHQLHLRKTPHNRFGIFTFVLFKYNPWDIVYHYKSILEVLQKCRLSSFEVNSEAIILIY